MQPLHIYFTVLYKYDYALIVCTNIAAVHLAISRSVEGSGAKSKPEDIELTRVVDEMTGVGPVAYLDGSFPLLSLLLSLVYVSLPLVVKSSGLS